MLLYKLDGVAPMIAGYESGTEAAERPAAPGCPAAVSQDRRRGAGGGGELGGGSRRRGR